MLEIPYLCERLQTSLFPRFLLSSKLSSIIIPNFMKSTNLFPELEVVLYSRLINNVVMVVRGFLDAK